MEENRIKKELAEIAMALNLEAQKARNDMNDFLKYIRIFFIEKYTIVFRVMNRDRTHTIKNDLDQEQKFEERLK